MDRSWILLTLSNYHNYYSQNQILPSLLYYLYNPLSLSLDTSWLLFLYYSIHLWNLSLTIQLFLNNTAFFDFPNFPSHLIRINNIVLNYILTAFHNFTALQLVEFHKIYLYEWWLLIHLLENQFTFSIFLFQKLDPAVIKNEKKKIDEKKIRKFHILVKCVI